MANATVRKDENNKPVQGDWSNQSISYNDLWVMCEKFKAEALRTLELQGEIKRIKAELAHERHKCVQLAEQVNRRNVIDHTEITVEMKLRAAEELLRQDKRKTRYIKVEKKHGDRG